VVARAHADTSHGERTQVARAAAGTQRQGRVRRRKTILISGIIVALSSGSVPAGASASSLLSGYGGPGEGNQAILGSTLLGGPSGGSGGGPTAGAPAVSAEAAGRTGAADSNRVGSHGPSASRKHRQKAVPGRSASTSRASSRLLTGEVPTTDIVGSQAFGISESDLLYIFIAVAALVVTAGLTRQLARQPRRGG
jgi:hypothetical protein